MRLISAFLCALALAQPAVAQVCLDGGSPSDDVLELQWPAQGTLTDGFGPRWGRMHLGLDIGILKSRRLVAAASGTVLETGWLDGYAGYGQVVTVSVGGGYRTMYAHLARIDVEPGAWLHAGDAIGLAGCTGSCTGTHLHFELHKHGHPVDPMPFIAR
jgi:murein DD-endopeptidase MepM/ murein hydrolase activator NlpD